MTKTHVLWAGADEVGKVVPLRPAKLHEAVWVELLRVFPDLGVPHVYHVNPDIVSLAQA